ncbi:MAG TPA: CAP domain-containing protein [Mucilaginibacter sp.]
MKRLFFGGLAALIISFCCISAAPQHINNDRFKQEFLDRINLARSKGCNCGRTYFPPAPPLIWNNDLENAARGHALDMSERNYFSHTSKDGRSMSDRVTQAGYNFKGYKSFIVGENIAQGQMSIPEVMDGWLKSEGHCRNLMNPMFKEVGVSEIDHYWVQDFGGRIPFSAREQELIKSGRVKLIQRDVKSGH